MSGLLERLVFQYAGGAASRLRVLAFRLMGAELGPGNRFEATVLRNARCIRIGRDNAFAAGARLVCNRHATGIGMLEIGNGNYFNVRFFADACGRIEIGSACLFGPDVYIADSNHRVQAGESPGATPMDVGRVRVGDRVWVGAGAKILAGVDLGDGCVVGAGSVVTRSVAAGAVVAGNPAREIRREG